MRPIEQIESRFYTGPESNSFSTQCPYNLSTMNIQSEIDRIISERALHGARLDQAERLIKKVSNAVRDFLSSKERTFGTLEKTLEFFGTEYESEARAMWEKMKNLDESSAREIGRKCGVISNMIQNARRRFKRKNICIAIVGNSGEGKSTLIQRITGLNDATIPSSGGGICTAARSKIINSTRFMARIEFYSEDEFIREVLAPYFVHFGVLDHPRNLVDIEHAKALLEDITVNKQDQFCQRVFDYCNMWTYYRDYLGSGTLELEDEADVREYVAKVNEDGVMYENPKYMAVKSVEIECPFPSVDVKSLILIDTIGVNEPTLNVKQQMFKTISEEADFVLFTKRSFSQRTTWLDTGALELYYEILRNLPGIPAYRWIYFVFNYTKNLSIGKDDKGLVQNGFQGNFARVMENQKDMPKDRTPGAFIDVDCMDEEEVSRYLIKPMLSHLAANLKYIDEQLIQSINEEINKLSAPMAQLAEAVNGLLLPLRDKNAIKLRLYPIAIGNMAQETRDKVDSICAELIHDGIDNQWSEKVNDTIADCESHIPGVERINEIYRIRNSALRTIEEIYSMTGSSLCHMFDGTHFQFDVPVAKVKKKFLRAFMEAGRFDKVESLKIDPEEENAIQKLAGMLFGNDQLMVHLKQEFERFNSFDIDHGRTLAQWMAETVHCIDPNNGDGNIPHYWAERGLAVEIIEKLRTSMSTIRNNFKAKVATMDSPMHRICKVFEQFVNTITQTGGETYTAWTVVFDPYLEQMYPEKFGDIKKYNDRADAWNKIIEILLRMREIQSIDF